MKFKRYLPLIGRCCVGLRFYPLIMVFAFVVVSCRSGRQAVDSDDYHQDSSAALSPKRLKTMLGELEAGYGNWEDVRMPVTLRLKNPGGMSINGSMSMKRGESVYLSLRVFGMEVASLMVTQDSVFGLYKLKKIYFAECVSDMSGGFPMTVSNVQDLMLGRAFALGAVSLEDMKCDLRGNGREWTVKPGYSPKDISYEFTVDTPTGNLERLSVELPSRKPITVEYSDFSTTDVGPVAGKTEFTASTSKIVMSGEMELNLRKAEWNKGKVGKWSEPYGYKRVRASEILKMLSGKH